MTNTTNPSWRDGKKVHPIARPFPPFESDVLQEMAKDIQNGGGLKLPVRTCVDDEGDFSVFEGVDRLDALELASRKLVRDFSQTTRRSGLALGRTGFATKTVPNSKLRRII